MSWIQKELKRRAADEARDSAAMSTVSGMGSIAQLQAASLLALWSRIDAANDQLPPELRLQRHSDVADAFAGDLPPFVAWLRAPNAAGLGFNGEGIRYVWPEHSLHKSNNFWIRGRAAGGYQVTRRMGSTMTSSNNQTRRFNESSTDHLLRCLVTGTRVTFRSVCKRRFVLF